MCKDLEHINNSQEFSLVLPSFSIATWAFRMTAVRLLPTDEPLAKRNSVLVKHVGGIVPAAEAAAPRHGHLCAGG